MSLSIHSKKISLLIAILCMVSCWNSKMYGFLGMQRIMVTDARTAVNLTDRLNFLCGLNVGSIQSILSAYLDSAVQQGKIDPRISGTASLAPIAPGLTMPLSVHHLMKKYADGLHELNHSGSSELKELPELPDWKKYLEKHHIVELYCKLAGEKMLQNPEVQNVVLESIARVSQIINDESFPASEPYLLSTLGYQSRLELEQSSQKVMSTQVLPSSTSLVNAQKCHQTFGSKRQRTASPSAKPKVSKRQRIESSEQGQQSERTYGFADASDSPAAMQGQQSGSSANAGVLINENCRSSVK